MHEGHHTILEIIIFVFLPVVLRSSKQLLCSVLIPKNCCSINMLTEEVKRGIYCNYTEEGIPHAIPSSVLKNLFVFIRVTMAHNKKSIVK